jgi:uncharacterized protein (TIGR04255 family)
MPVTKLPTFKKPPVVETVLGVQFDPIRGFTNAHLGAFRVRVKQAASAGERWMRVSDAVPLPPTFERFDDEHAWMDVGLTLTFSQEPPASRLQIRNESGGALIQLQNGRLHYNWIRQVDGAYVRYRNVRPGFDAIFAELAEFLVEQGLGEIKPNQWEVTYVNHIPKGTVWNTPEEWAHLFIGLPSLGSPQGEIRLESFGGMWHFEIPERRGRLHVEVSHAKTQEEPKEELIRLTLTARGPIEPPAGGAIAASRGLDLGRQVIVTAFRDLTSERAHLYWELET